MYLVHALIWCTLFVDSGPRTDIGAKMGTVPIRIGIGICIGIRVGSVETLLHITIVAIFYRYRNRNRNRAVETHHQGLV